MTTRRHEDGHRPPGRSRVWRSVGKPRRCSRPFARPPDRQERAASNQYLPLTRIVQHTSLLLGERQLHKMWLADTGEKLYDKPETHDIGNAPAGSAFLPLARAGHRALALRRFHVGNPPGRLAVPRFFAPFRTHTAPAARDPAGAAGYLSGVCFCTARVDYQFGAPLLPPCIRFRCPLHLALPDRPRDGPTAGRDAWHPRVSACHDDTVA